MSSDPTTALSIAIALGVAWTMCLSGLKKNLLEPRRRERRCPSCGRHIVGRTCDTH